MNYNTFERILSHVFSFLSCYSLLNPFYSYFYFHESTKIVLPRRCQAQGQLQSSTTQFVESICLADPPKNISKIWCPVYLLSHDAWMTPFICLCWIVFNFSSSTCREHPSALSSHLLIDPHFCGDLTQHHDLDPITGNSRYSIAQASLTSPNLYLQLTTQSHWSEV